MEALGTYKQVRDAFLSPAKTVAGITLQPPTLGHVLLLAQHAPRFGGEAMELPEISLAILIMSTPAEGLRELEAMAPEALTAAARAIVMTIPIAAVAGILAAMAEMFTAATAAMIPAEGADTEKKTESAGGSACSNGRPLNTTGQFAP